MILYRLKTLNEWSIGLQQVWDPVVWDRVFIKKDLFQHHFFFKKNLQCLNSRSLRRRHQASFTVSIDVVGYASYKRMCTDLSVCARDHPERSSSCYLIPPNWLKKTVNVTFLSKGFKPIALAINMLNSLTTITNHLLRLQEPNELGMNGGIALRP